jgi:hypothetical protein
MMAGEGGRRRRLRGAQVATKVATGGTVRVTRGVAPPPTIGAVTDRMKHLGAAGALLLLLLVAAATPSPAGAAGFTTREYTVEVTGVHHVDWSWQGDGYDQDCRDWTAGSGEATIGFSQPRPARYRLLTLSGKLPAGAPRVTWMPASTGRTRISARRSARDWKDHLAPGRCSPCEQEGGGCAPAPDRPQPAAPPACPARSPQGTIAVGYYPDGDLPDTGTDDDLLAGLGPALQVEVSVRTASAFSRCLPDVRGELRLYTPDPMTVTVHNVRPLERLAVGGKVTRKGSWERRAAGAPNAVPALKESNTCDEGVGGPGYEECAVTDVTVEIRRRR